MIETETWKQPFQWGLLMAFDAELDFELPRGIGTESIVASTSCVAVPVIHAQDVEVLDDFPDDAELPQAEVQVTVTVGPASAGAEFVATLECPSGRLNVGDAESFKVLDVPKGTLAIAVTRQPQQFAESVTIEVSRP